MANKFLYNAAAGSGAGTDYTNAYTTIAAALAGTAAGDTLFVAADHVEPNFTANQTFTALGTSANPIKILTTNRVAGVPAATDLVTAPSSIFTTTGGSNITLAGYVSVAHGMSFSVGDAANTANILCNSWNLNKCAVRLTNTSPSSFFRASATGVRVTWTDTTIYFGAVAQFVAFLSAGEFVWRGPGSTLAAGSQVPNALFGASCAGHCMIEGADLSWLVIAKAIMNYQTANRAIVVIKDCKMPATASYLRTSGTAAVGTGELIIVSSASDGSNWMSEKWDGAGRQEADITAVRTGAATDGTTPVSWKFTPLAATCKPDNPFTSLPITIWNDTIGSARTLTMYGIATAIPNNNECWIEAEYHSDTATPIGAYVSSGLATPISTAVANASDTSVWTGALTGKFKMAVTFTPQMKGYVTIRIKIGVASATIYVDPKPVIT